MKRTISTLSFCLTFLVSLCQQNQEEKFSSEDSVCLRKAMAMINQIKAEGTKAKYYKDDEFLITLSRANSDGNNKIRVLNFGNDKTLSVTILEIKVAAYDSVNNMSIISLNTPMELIKEQKIAHCSSFSVNLSKIGLLNTVNSEINYIKIKISFSDKDVIAKLGKEE